MRLPPVSALITLVKADTLVGRVASNAARQGVGAALFFATTLLLSGSLGTRGYATFFRDSNAANLIAAFTEFGLYADILRRLVLGQSRAQVARAVWRPQVLQFAAVAVICSLAGRFSDYDGSFVFTVACSQIVGNLLSATALGCDRFRIFMAGELTQNSVFFVLVAAVSPHDPCTAGYLVAASVGVKCVAYVLLWRRDEDRQQAGRPSAPASDPVPGYASRVYLHTLALIGTYRGYFVVIGWVLGPQRLETIALAWSLCDRALVLVQGICLVLQPRWIAGAVSRRARNVTYAGTVAAFVIVALTMNGAAYLWLQRSGQGRPGMLGLSVLLCMAFVPHVLRVLRLSEFTAMGRFRAVFSSHVAATLVFAGVAIIAPLAGINGAAFATALVGAASLAGLLASHEPPLANPAEETGPG